MGPSGAAEAPEIEAVICSYERTEHVRAAVASVLSQAGPGAPRTAVIVVWNGPVTEAVAALRDELAADPRVRFLVQAVPGISRARNRAVEAARAPILGFLDDDARAHEGWGAAHLAGFAAFPRAGLSAGRTLLALEGERPSWLEGWMESYLSVADLGGALREAAPDEPVIGANMAVRVEAVRAVGGFRDGIGRIGGEAVLLSGEESALRIDLAGAGWRTLYQPEAVADHLVPASRLDKDWFRRRLAWQAVSRAITVPEKAAREAHLWRDAFRPDRLSHWRRRRMVGRLLRDDVPDEAFGAQLRAIHGMVTALVADTRLAEPPPAAETARSLARKAVARLAGRLRGGG